MRMRARTTAALLAFALAQAASEPRVWAQTAPHVDEANLGGAAPFAAGVREAAPISPATNLAPIAPLAPPVPTATVAQTPSALVPEAAAPASAALKARPAVVHEGTSSPAPGAVPIAESAPEPSAVGKILSEASAAGAAGPDEKEARPAPSPISQLLDRLALGLMNFDRRDPELGYGDFVVVGAPGQTVSMTNGELTFLATLPLLAKIDDPQGASPRALMALVTSPETGNTGLLNAPFAREHLQKIYRRELSAPVRDLRHALTPSIGFEPGERVRVRDEGTGRLRQATFVGLQRRGGSKKYELRDADGSAFLSPVRLVYKDAPGPVAPRTPGLKGNFPLYGADGLWPEMSPRRGDALESFLDGAAWLSSHPEFVAAALPERWALLERYLRAFIGFNMAAGFAENLDVGIPTLLTWGFGVCRHLASLLYAVLSETGYQARIMIYASFVTKSGHAWIEVEGPSRTDDERYILDPTSFPMMMPWTEALARARADAGSMAALYYTQPERVQYPESHIF